MNNDPDFQRDAMIEEIANAYPELTDTGMLIDLWVRRFNDAMDDDGTVVLPREER